MEKRCAGLGVGEDNLLSRLYNSVAKIDVLSVAGVIFGVRLIKDVDIEAEFRGLDGPR